MRSGFYLLVMAACAREEAASPSPVAPLDLSTIPEEYREAPIPAQHGGVDLSYDATLADPVTAYADCSALVLACVDSGSSDFDACVPATTTCASAEPWKEEACCPAACKDAYAAARGKGEVGFDAFMAVFVTDTSCFPGLEG